MIQLSEAESGELQAKFDGVPDRDLIRELLRRGRFREYNCTAEFFKELRGEDQYMGMIRNHVLHGIARAIDDDKNQRPALISEYPEVVDPYYRKTIMEADVIVLNRRSHTEG